jgi:hypothetical protein
MGTTSATTATPNGSDKETQRNIEKEVADDMEVETDGDDTLFEDAVGMEDTGAEQHSVMDSDMQDDDDVDKMHNKEPHGNKENKTNAPTPIHTVVAFDIQGTMQEETDDDDMEKMHDKESHGNKEKQTDMPSHIHNVVA